MAFIEYEHLNESQKLQANFLRPNWSKEDFKRVSFWVRPDGKISSRSGYHRLTAFAIEELRRMSRESLDGTISIDECKTNEPTRNIPLTKH